MWVGRITRVTELFDLQQTLYNSRNPTRRWLHTTRRDRIEALLRRHARGGRALEVGPGSGVYLPLLSQLFEHVVASDIEREFLEQAPQLPNVELVEDDIEDTRLEAGSFDLVLMSEVIEHIPNPARALASIKRLLKPGGVLILSTPQRHSPLELLGKVAFLPGIVQLVRLVYREPILPTGHISLLSRREAGQLLADAGFTVEEQDLSGLYLPLLAETGGTRALKLEQRLEPKLARGRLSGALWIQYHVARA
jgi:SAM-dependent methyltransferase